MADTIDLFAADPIAERMASAERRGQRITPWVRHMLRAWAENVGNKPMTEAAGVIKPNGSTYIEVGNLPIPCNCADCQEPALIFPPDESCPQDLSKGIGGYCLCPRCSFGLIDEQATGEE